jgi:hypothetical protein
VYRREHPMLRLVDPYATRHFFRATGCGHSVLYMCDVPASVHIPNGRMVYFTCEPIEADSESSTRRLL